MLVFPVWSITLKRTHVKSALYKVGHCLVEGQNKTKCTTQITEDIRPIAIICFLSYGPVCTACPSLLPNTIKPSTKQPKHLYVIDTKQMLGSLVLQLSQNDCVVALTQLQFRVIGSRGSSLYYGTQLQGIWVSGQISKDQGDHLCSVGPNCKGFGRVPNFQTGTIAVPGTHTSLHNGFHGFTK
jgi:hypothetical protein